MAKQLRIGLINEYFPPHAVGGAEWSSLRLAETLVEQGHAVHVITPDYSGNGAHETRGALQITRYPLPPWLRRPVPVNSLWLGNPWFYGSMARHIASVVKTDRLDILHAQNKYSVPAVLIAGRLTGRPTVATVRDYINICPTGMCLQRGEPPPQSGDLAHYERCFWRFYRQYDGRPGLLPKGKRWARFMLWETADLALRRASLSRMDAVIAVSQATADLHALAGIAPDRLRVVYNVPPPVEAVDPAAARHLSDRLGLGNAPVVAIVGKLSIGKGTPVLLEAARRTLRAVPETVFVLAGRAEMPVLIDHDLTGSIRLPGVLSQPEVRALYERARLVVVPSRWPEPFSRVLLEAMAAGRPLVGTRVGGTPEAILHGDTGWIVPPGDAGALSRAIVSLLRAPALADAMGQRGRERVETVFHPAVSYQQLLDVYQDVAGRSG